MWKGGVVSRTDGYVYLLVGSEHPFSTKEGYILEHRAVIERWLREAEPNSQKLIRLGEKLYLSPDWHVHHIDGDRANNRLENLMCVTPEEHREIHKAMRESAQNND